MQFHLHPLGDLAVAEVMQEGYVLHDGHAAGELILNAGYQGAEAMLLRMEQLPASFFNLSSGLAGEILQAFSTYRMRVAIVGDFTLFSSHALKDFMRESNRRGGVSFVSTREEALAALSR